MHTTPPQSDRLLHQSATPNPPFFPMNHSHHRLSSVKFSRFFRFFRVSPSVEFSLTLAWYAFETITTSWLSLRKMWLMHSNAYSLTDKSLCPVFRRRWSSIYEALQDSRPQRQELMKLCIEQMPSSVRPILAGDHTIWPRPLIRWHSKNVQLSIKQLPFPEIARLV